jgi:hypothetical protein
MNGSSRSIVIAGRVLFSDSVIVVVGLFLSSSANLREEEETVCALSNCLQL